MRRISKINDYLCRKQSLVILFPVAFVIGAVTGIFISKVTEVKAWIECYFSLLLNVSLNLPHLFVYVLAKRLKHLLLLCVLCFVPFGPVLYHLYIACGCMAIGVVFACVCSLNGMSGVIIAFVNVFPHLIFYGIFLFVGFELYYYCWNKVRGGDLSGQLRRRFYVVISGIKIHLIWVLALVAIMGVVTECYVNPFLLKFFVNILLK